MFPPVRRILPVATALSFLLAFAEAAIAATDVTPDVPIIAFLKKKGVSLNLLGKNGDISVWMGEREGQMQYFTVLPDGHRAVSGILFDDSGRDLTGEFLAKAANAGQIHLPSMPTAAAATNGSAAAPAAVKPANIDEILRAAAGTHWLSYGPSGAPVIYMMADPECIFCRTVWPQVISLATDKKIELRVIPVAFIHGDESMAALTAILSAPSPAKAWALSEDGIRTQPSSSNATDAVRGIINDNHLFASHYGLAATPVFLWSSADGPKMQTGIPKSADGATDVGIFLR
ncbi:thioredoxin fold domain-containing protein [Telmatospirillum siberiense]|uniref:Uncharacterized protein n=1 Tax=Telmatospirillum siberiense TaxID=382514 RepID=A0A2N3PNI5_9PROT|nr:thioredoxin fold domain-containing protein [Telmatospirillum siberiense]PKU21955.1 hypothetical protein CWS72_23925 [Telmatospirillum siberiense]